MKSLLVSTVLFTLLFVGCMDAMDDNFSFVMDKTLAIDHPAQSSGAVSDTLYLWESAVPFMRNRSSVRSLDIRSISCSIVGTDGVVAPTISGTLNVGNFKGSLQKIARLDNVSMASMMAGTHGMDMYGSGGRMMGDMMMDMDDMMLYFECDSSQDSMHLMMQFHFEVNARCSNMGMMK